MRETNQVSHGDGLVAGSEAAPASWPRPLPSVRDAVPDATGYSSRDELDELLEACDRMVDAVKILADAAVASAPADRNGARDE